VAFQVDATGERPVSYQWQHDGTLIPDSNTNRLAFASLTLADAGNYAVTVQNSKGSATSATAALTVQSITNVTTGLVGYWPMDETSGSVLADASGHGHDAALQNATAAAGTPGVIGGAFDFDGVGAFAIVPSAPDLDLFDQGTIAVWINPRSFGVPGSGGYGRIVRKDINYDWNVYSGAGDTLLFFGINKTAYDAPAGTVQTNQWQHFAVVIKNGTIQFFKNGRAVAAPIPGLLGPAVTNDLIIGNFGPDLTINRLFNGYMDDLGIWNRALTPSEIDGIYENGLAGKPLTASFQPLQIDSLAFTNSNQVRLIFSSPYTGRQYGIERADDLTLGTWSDQTPATINSLGGGLFEAIFDKPAGSAAFYRVSLQAQQPLYFENFETGAPGWTHGGAGDDWELGTPVNGPGRAYSGTNVYATSLTGNINPYSQCYLRSPVVDLTGVTRATLTFEEWRNVDPDVTFQGTQVNVLDPSSMTVLQQPSVLAGSSGGWQPRTLPLPPSVLGRKVILEFQLYCDAYNLLEGWYIDDVQILPQ
jgi:Concanavalin A-like lectin/glucanases superfamily